MIFYFVWFGLRKKIEDLGFFFFFFACCVLVVVVVLVLLVVVGVGVADGRGGCGRFCVCFF